MCLLRERMHFELYRKIGFEVLGRDEDSYELSLTI